MLKYEFGPERTILFSDHFEAHFGHEFGDGEKRM
jgi:peptide methionine sulfoxide reductase MsrB